MKLPLLLILLCSVVCGGEEYVKRSVLVSGPHETAGYWNLVSTSYGFTERDLDPVYTTVGRAQAAIQQQSALLADLTLLPSRLPESEESWATHLPLALYAISAIYNTLPPAPPNDLGEFVDFFLDQATFIAVWRGDIANWNDEAMLMANGYARIPTGPIKLVVQSYSDPLDEFASITGVFGRYLASIDPSGFGVTYAASGGNLTATLLHYNAADRVVALPVPDLGTASQPLAEAASLIDGSITYDTWARASAAPGNMLNSALINSAGVYLAAPSVTGLQAALGDFDSATAIDIFNGVSSFSWPIAGVVYGVVPRYTTRPDCSYLDSLMILAVWTQSNSAFSQRLSGTVEGAPLSLGFGKRTLDATSEVTCNGRSATGIHLFYGGGRPLRTMSALADNYDPTGSTIRIKSIDLDPLAVLTKVAEGNIDHGIVETDHQHSTPESVLVSGANFTMIPFSVSAIVPAYNLPELVGASYRLSFSPATIASILSNVTTKWNDFMVLEDNPDLVGILPDREIIFVSDQGGSLTRSGGPAGGYVNRRMAQYLVRGVPSFNTSISRPGGGIAYPIEDEVRFIKAGDAGVSATLREVSYSLGFDVLNTVTEARTIAWGGLRASSKRQSGTVLPDTDALLSGARTNGTSGWPIVFWNRVLLRKQQTSSFSAVASELEWIYWTQTDTDRGLSVQQEKGTVPASMVSVRAASDVLQALRSVVMASNGQTAFLRAACMNPVNGTMCSEAGQCVVNLGRLSASCDCDTNYQGLACETYVAPASGGSAAVGSSDGQALQLGLGIGVGVGVSLILCIILAAFAIALVIGFVVRSHSQQREPWDIDISEIELGDMLGTGGFGEVRKAVWKGTDVAIKIFPDLEHPTRGEMAQLREEIDVMSRVRHRNIVLFMAACARPPRVCIIMEHMELGSLFDLLHNELVPAIPLALRLKIAHNVASGMHYLHSSGIVHRDLKSPNVLLDSKWNAKVSDFGLSTTIYRRRGADDRQALGSVHWAAPEVLEESPDTDFAMADVYSYGIVLWEILTREKPYAHLGDFCTPAAVAVSVLRDGARPYLSDEVPCVYLDPHDAPLEDAHAEMRKIVAQCWDQDSSARPSFVEILNSLISVQAEMRKHVGVSAPDLSNGSSASSPSGTSSLSVRDYPKSLRDGSHTLRRNNAAAAAYMPLTMVAPDGIAAMVFIDVVGAVRIWETDFETAAEATRLFNQTVRTYLAYHGGFEAQIDAAPLASAGAGTFFLVFRTAADAVRLCAALQKALVELEWPEKLYAIQGAHKEYSNLTDQPYNSGLRVRMGVDWGACRRNAQDQTKRVAYTGPAVKGAAFFTTLGSAGQILLSQEAYLQYARECPGADPLGTVRVLRITKSHEHTTAYQLVPAGLEARLDEPVHGTRPDNGDEDDDDDDGKATAPEKDMRLDVLGSANTCRWFVGTEEVEVLRRIGEGAMSVVHRGKWKGTDVAVKFFNHASRITEDRMLDFRREMAYMSGLRHNNVVFFVAACVSGNKIAIITEYMSLGSLKDVLANKVDHRLRWPLKLAMARDAAAGICYLHGSNPPIIHRDIKSSNLLVNEYYTVKVSDFGFARIKQDNVTMTHCGTSGWMAPEVIQNQAYDERADVYSFGIVLWEILTHKRPFAGEPLMKVSMDVIGGRRPQIPGDCPKDYAKLIARCWHQNPDKRPTMAEVHDRLCHMIGEGGGASLFAV
ncbi:Ser/Thr protein kinase [Medusavirus stheno T3]|uniref:Ser/Thr protein kinase n=1 Tax=Medusavirus stheno T3 TaxID=3069717 RepID=A0A7S7YEP8_9VIRU|nr:Ser/Thr protein kinase [Acanthamoeba castellanii medusavirus]QPB44429.1 Ser/Thr protein kinase [Medusavirus stheno T3]